MRFAAASLWAASMSPWVDFSRSASWEMPSITSSGSIVLPFDFDIFWPSASRTIALMYTSRKALTPANCRVVMIMRATQKKMMSKPVTSTVEGR